VAEITPLAASRHTVLHASRNSRAWPGVALRRRQASLLLAKLIQDPNHLVQASCPAAVVEGWRKQPSACVLLVEMSKQVYVPANKTTKYGASAIALLVPAVATWDSIRDSWPSRCRSYVDVLRKDGCLAAAHSPSSSPPQPAVIGADVNVNSVSNAPRSSNTVCDLLLAASRANSKVLCGRELARRHKE
jgi:hypothetical protein